MPVFKQGQPYFLYTAKNNSPSETVIEHKDVSLTDHDVIKRYFESISINDFYMSSDKDEIIVYEDEMVFCCGVVMRGKNQLVYHINEKELIDSLVILSIESGEVVKFEYVYE